MFYDWLFFRKLVEHPCVAVHPILCVGKKDKKEIKALGSSLGDLLHQKSRKSPLEEYYYFTCLPS